MKDWEKPEVRQVAWNMGGWYEKKDGCWESCGEGYQPTQNDEIIRYES